MQLHTAQQSIDTFPQDLLTTYNRMKVAFPGSEIGASVVIKTTDVEAPEVTGRRSTGSLRRRWRPG